MAVTDTIRLRNHRRLIAQLDVRISSRAFAGSTLDVLYNEDGLADLDEAAREPLLAFAGDFLDCGCAPFCGHPERKFVRYLLALREDGFDPEEIVAIMGDDYNLTAYPGDILSFLDEAVRRLEALEALADVDGKGAYRTEVARRRRALEG